jgi:hypothetical protein
MRDEYCVQGAERRDRGDPTTYKGYLAAMIGSVVF